MAFDEQAFEEFKRRQVPVQPSGIPAAGPSSVVEDVTGAAKAAGRFAKTAALPTLGSVALPVAATALFPPAAPFTPLLRGVGSGLGEAANQLLGITEPSLGQIGLATGLPIASEVGTNLLRTGKALAPALQTKAPAMAMKQMAGYRSATPSKELFEQATKAGTMIPLKKTEEAVQAMRNTMVHATPARKQAFESVLKKTGLEDVITAPGQGVNPSQMQFLLDDIGALQADAAKQAGSGIEKKYLGNFFASLSDDLEASGSSLQVARQAYKREKVLLDLDDAIQNAFFIKKGQGAQGEFSANKVLNTLNRTNEGIGKFFAQAFTPKEQREVRDLFVFLNTLPSLKPGAGQTFGSGQFFERVSKAALGGSMGGGIGFAMGGPAGAGVGTAVGVAAPAIADFSRLLVQAWRMPGGRQIVRSLLTNSEGAVTPQIMGTLGAFVAGKLATERKPAVASEPSGLTQVPTLPLER